MMISQIGQTMKGTHTMSDEAVRLAINDLLVLTQTTAKNTAEPANVRAFAAVVNERVRVIIKLLNSET
jgi:hypothetical protein